MGATSRDRLIVLVLLGVLAFGVVSRGLLSTENLVFYAVLIPSVILHEVSHGAAALLFGDPTARDAGRLTLNPVNHIDPFGTLILPALLVLTTGTAFGYARPVPVDPRRLRSPRNHGLVVSLVGPAVNIALAVLAAVLLVATTPAWLTAEIGLALRHGQIPELAMGQGVLVSLGLANVLLATFNLIPLPPLDGSAVIERLLPARMWPGWLRLRRYAMVVLVVVVLALPRGLTFVFEPAIRLWAHLL